MGLFSAIFGNRPKEPKHFDGAWKLLDGYTPHFSTWGGSIYESQLIRAAIEVIATHVGKLGWRSPGRQSQRSGTS